MKYNSKKVRGRNYTVPMSSMLEDVIGPRRVAKNSVEIAKACGRSSSTARIVIGKMHDEGLVYIKRWKRGEVGPYIPYYKLGKGVDAKKPEPMTNAEKHKRYRESENGSRVCKKCRDRWQKSERGIEYRQNYDKAKWAREKLESGGLARIDPLMAAIYGVSNGNHPR